MNEAAAPLIWVASGLGAVLLLVGGGWATWLSLGVIALGNDMARVKLVLGISDDGKLKRRKGDNQ